MFVFKIVCNLMLYMILRYVREPFQIHIIERFPRIINGKIARLKQVLLAPRDQSSLPTKHEITFKYSWKIFCNKMLYMILQYSGSNPADINWFRSHTGNVFIKI